MADQNEDKKIPPHAAKTLAWLGVLCVAVLIMTFLALAVPKLFGWEGSENINWVLLLFGGFAFLLVALFSASALFRTFGIHDTNHSLALPRNTIRSLLTFLVFMILMTFIFYSTHIVSTKDETGNMTILKGGYAQMIDSLGLKGRVTKVVEVLEVRNSNGDIVQPAQFHIQFMVEKESVSLEYLDRILVALLGISSTIIGFYFGTRSREDPGNEAQRADPGATPPRAPPVAPEELVGDAADGAEWDIASDMLEFSPREVEGGFAGHVTILTDALDDLGEFDAEFEPSDSGQDGDDTKEHDRPTDNARVSVQRVDDRLTITVEKLTEDEKELTAEHLKDARMVIFFRDEEDHARTIPVEVV